MAKKFDVVIGNPPYQKEAGGSATHSMPIYHEFMEAAYEVGTQAVLITPARFLFKAGYTPQAWNEKMLNDPHLSVAQYTPNSDDLFPGTNIVGGIVVTHRDAEKIVPPIEVFTSYPELNGIMNKVAAHNDESISSEITSSRSYAYTDAMHSDYPAASDSMAKGEKYKLNTRTFELLPDLYHSERPEDGQDYVEILGIIKGKRVFRWIRSEHVTGPSGFRKYKVIVPASRGHLGSLGDEPAVIIGTPLLGMPNVGVTQSFITIGSFDTEEEGRACLKYVQSKFARTLLGVLKITQGNSAKVWKHVPLQDFTAASDIDWTGNVVEIDQQLYAKYKLTGADIDFIEKQVKPIG